MVDLINALNARITQARDHFMEDEFTHGDLQAVKTQCETEINSLEKKLPIIFYQLKGVSQKLTGGYFTNLKLFLI